MRKAGFTLIELLVVISLIGILATLVTANLTAGRARGRDVARKSDLRSVGTSLRLYYNDKGTFPVSTTGGEIEDFPWGTKWSSATAVYMEALPKDPLPGGAYMYILDSADDTFTLSACLENKSDDRCDKSGGQIVSCTGGADGCLYTIKP